MVYFHRRLIFAPVSGKEQGEESCARQERGREDEEEIDSDGFSGKDACDISRTMNGW